MNVQVADQIGFTIDEDVLVHALAMSETQEVWIAIQTKTDDVEACIENYDDLSVLDLCSSLTLSKFLLNIQRSTIYDPMVRRGDKESKEKEVELVVQVLEAFRIIKEGK